MSKPKDIADMRNRYLSNKALTSRGISLVEVTVIIIVVGLLAALAMRSMTPVLKDAKVAETNKEMDMLVKAIAGDPGIMSVAGGERSDFGYVGDVGALPDSLGALMHNPGGYATWSGPYLSTDFTGDPDWYKNDQWGAAYSYDGLAITSTGSGSSLVRKVADLPSHLLLNQVFGLVWDANDSVPGLTWEDSVNVEVTIPNGIGSTLTKIYHPDSAGEFRLDSIPIGRHRVEVIYLPDVDTLTRYVTVVPRQSNNEIVRFNFDTTYFLPEESEAAGLTMVAGSDTAYSTFTGTCNNIRFWFENATADAIQIEWVTLEYSTTAFYQILDYEADDVYEFNNSAPRNGSTDKVIFAAAQTVPAGESRVIEVETFKATVSGTGASVDMSSTTFTVTFSDGSTFDVAISYCE